MWEQINCFSIFNILSPYIFTACAKNERKGLVGWGFPCLVWGFCCFVFDKYYKFLQQLMISNYRAVIQTNHWPNSSPVKPLQATSFPVSTEPFTLPPRCCAPALGFQQDADPTRFPQGRASPTAVPSSPEWTGWPWGRWCSRTLLPWPSAARPCRRSAGSTGGPAAPCASRSAASSQSAPWFSRSAKQD